MHGPQWKAKGIAWIEAFDQIQLVETWQILVDLFGEESASEHLAGALRRKLWAIFGPDAVMAKPIKVKASPKPAQESDPRSAH